ncbi:MAG: hypothetical protein WC770_10235 [Phycisphaerae bacterium]|jgi:hypothetical protein|nr:MAG: hypothetical protein A2Y13_11020 [Planctomycetes bacterium GWC2_45_44]HBG78687.1 hypothetical protein [Phycisphaerales bacterium]HBR20043.1 hypothetical protein [Phycisphaerales bacterium]
MANILAIAGNNSTYKQPGGSPAGFLSGLWHGAIAPFTFIVSIFIENVSMYETNNNGVWYEWGFLMGISGALGSSQASRIHIGG